MSAISRIVSRVVGGGRAAAGPRRTTGTGAGGVGTGGMGTTPGGRRRQDEAVGRGVRSLLRRFR